MKGQNKIHIDIYFNNFELYSALIRGMNFTDSKSQYFLELAITGFKKRFPELYKKHIQPLNKRGKK